MQERSEMAGIGFRFFSYNSSHVKTVKAPHIAVAREQVGYGPRAPSGPKHHVFLYR